MGSCLACFLMPFPLSPSRLYLSHKIIRDIINSCEYCLTREWVTMETLEERLLEGVVLFACLMITFPRLTLRVVSSSLKIARDVVNPYEYSLPYCLQSE